MAGYVLVYSGMLAGFAQLIMPPSVPPAQQQARTVRILVVSRVRPCLRSQETANNTRKQSSPARRPQKKRLCRIDFPAMRPPARQDSMQTAQTAMLIWSSFIFSLYRANDSASIRSPDRMQEKIKERSSALGQAAVIDVSFDKGGWFGLFYSGLGYIMCRSDKLIGSCGGIEQNGIHSV